MIESGGGMTDFLETRVRLFQEDARYEQKNFLGFLAMVSESTSRSSSRARSF